MDETGSRCYEKYQTSELDLSKTEDKTITIKNSNLSHVKLPKTCEKLNLVDSRITIL